MKVYTEQQVRKALTTWLDSSITYTQDDIIRSLTPIELSDEEWVGCDGCTETDEYFWKKGFQAGYNKVKPVEISDEEIEKEVNSNPYINDDASFIEGAKWYREQLKSR